MRIAFIVNQFPVLSQTFVLNQITGLMDRGHEVDIYTDVSGDWSQVHPDVNHYRLQEHTYLMQAVPQNYLWRALKGFWLALIHFHRDPGLIARAFNIREYGGQAAGLWLLYSAISLLAGPRHYDIIHSQFGTEGYRALTFKRLLEPTPKLLVMFRGHDISAYIQQEGDRLYQLTFQGVDYCLANCHFFRKKVIDLGWDPERIAVHLSGLDVNKFAFHPRFLNPGEPIRIATTGRLVEKKGIEYAIRAVVKQANYFPELSYLIIGDGPLRDSLQALITELGAGSYIHLLGWKTESEMIEILNTCHLFIAPSVTAANGDQDAPINVLKEAMAMGLPIISTYHGGIPELVEDGVSGLLVPERDVPALAEKLGYLLTHPESWIEMGKAGRLCVEQHYDLHPLNDKLVTLYQNLLAS